MTRWLAACLVLAACERADHARGAEAFVFDDDPPAVGDTSEVHQHITLRFRPRVAELVEDRDLVYTTTVTEVRDGRSSAERLVIERDVNTQDGRPLPAMAGAYAVRRSDAGAIGAREDGRPLDAHEQAFFAGLPPPFTPEQRATLHLRAFHTGDRFEPNAIELRGLGLGAASETRAAEIHVLRADVHGMTLEAAFEEVAKSSIVGKTTVHQTVTSTDLQQTRDSVWRDGDKQLGTMHGTASARYTPAAATSPRPR